MSNTPDPSPTSTNDSGKRITSEGLTSLEEDVKEIMLSLQEVLESGGSENLAALLPWVKDDSVSPDLKDAEDIAEVYSIAFQLLDMVEERASLEARKEREIVLGPEAEKGLWPRCLKSLKRDGFSEEEIAGAMKSVRVEPVFTAHPTEAKRPSVRERHRSVYERLLRMKAPGQSDYQKGRSKEDFMTSLEALWNTGEIHEERPTIERELRNALFYLREVFPDTIEEINQRLDRSWQEAGFDLETLRGTGDGPKMRFGLWIGGDRDGHPFVTADTTRTTLAELRTQAIKLYRRELADAAYRLTVSATTHPVPEALTDRINEIAAALGAEGAYILGRNPEEPWRAFAYLLRANFEADNSLTVSSFRSDLELMKSSLVEIDANRLAARIVQPILNKLEAFGLHLAALDVRQNSEFHDNGVAQLLTAAGIEDGENFADWSEDKRVAFLSEELESSRPFLHTDQSAGTQADAVRDCYKVLAEHRQNRESGLGALIVSMTRQLSDLLVVHLFAREAGLTIENDGKLTCALQVVPLFETLDDLENAADIVDAFLQHPVTKRNLAVTTSPEKPTQQIMLGYSDSNKDGGILASQWGLRSGQDALTKVGKKHGVEFRYFHGRGGTISRGAGPTNWFMRALPHGSMTGDFRMTEQGETIAQKYAYPDNAAYHLEGFEACVTRTAVYHLRKEEKQDPGLELFPELSRASREAYRELLEADDFMSFYRQATPIDALELTEMGSRPSRRTGGGSLDDLRAIPWVFSWTQARFYLPGWYGAGSALDDLKTNLPNEFDHLAETISSSTFARYVFTGVETNLLSSNLELMRSYASLVEDESIRSSFMTRIENEFQLARARLSDLFPKPIEERRPRYAKTLALRENPLEILHQQQVELLRNWRKSGDTDQLPRPLIFSISAIASGLRTTG